MWRVFEETTEYATRLVATHFWITLAVSGAASIGTVGALLLSINILRRQTDLQRRHQASKVSVHLRDEPLTGVVHNASDLPIYGVLLVVRCPSVELTPASFTMPLARKFYWAETRSRFHSGSRSAAWAARPVDLLPKRLLRLPIEVGVRGYGTEGLQPVS